MVEEPGLADMEAVREGRQGPFLHPAGPGPGAGRLSEPAGSGMETDVLDEGGRLPVGLKAPPGPDGTLGPLPTWSGAEEISRLPGRLCLCQWNKAAAPCRPGCPAPTGPPICQFRMLVPVPFCSQEVFSGSSRQRRPDLANKNRGL